MATAAWDATREQNLKNGSSNKGDVLYWMARDQRATYRNDNGYLGRDPGAAPQGDNQ